MKRYIHASEDITDGFLFTKGNKALFLVSDAQNLTDKIIRKFINAICDERGVGDAIREKALYDKATLADFRKRIDKASLIEKDWGYSLSGKGFTMNFPEEDFNNEVIVIH